MSPSPGSAGGAIVSALSFFFDREVALAKGDRLLVAFSGGIDSTALLWGLQQLARLRPLSLRAAHVDHGIDSDSKARAAAAEGLARRIGVELDVQRHRVAERRTPGECLEAAARRIRYEALEQLRQSTGARYIVTAHHCNDQLETLALRLLYGSGLSGLGGIRKCHGCVIRPLLELPRSTLEEANSENGLEPVFDPTNDDLSFRRNKLRKQTLPQLLEREPDLASKSQHLAATAAATRSRLNALLERHLQLASDRLGPTISQARFSSLPLELTPWALALLHRRAGATYPPRSSAASELLRQLTQGGRVRCDASSAWQWQADGQRLRLLQKQAETPAFTYTLQIPGELWIPEISLGIRMVQGGVRPWMFGASSRRAGLALDLEPGAMVTIRNRRPGDRIRSFGSKSFRRLKGLLGACGVPRHRRSQIPLLCDGDRILWVPGVTQDEASRIQRQDPKTPESLEPSTRTPRATTMIREMTTVWIAQLYSQA